MTQDLNPIQKPQPVYVIVQQSIRDYIFDNNLKSGDSLPSEGDLAKQLGVSRNAVREAIKALEAVGFVESRRGSGIYVGKFSLEPIIVNLPYSLLSDLKQLSDLLEIR